MPSYLPIDEAEFDRLMHMLSHSTEFSGTDEDVVLSLYQLRRECAIVHAMSEQERRTPELALEPNRRDHIARAAGVTPTEVFFLVQRQKPGTASERANSARRAGWRVTTLCPATHSEMAKGKCPWCGRDLFNGRPRW